MKTKALILTGYGINCDYETKNALELAGAQAECVHLNDLILKKRRLEEFNLLAIPGGFSFGDDIASGKVLCNKIKYNLSEEISNFVREGKLIIGICNGFQVLVKFGLLPALGKKYFEQTTTLTFNDSGRFEDRWVYLKGRESGCVFTKGIDNIYLPVRHGEGKFVPVNEEVRKKLWENKQIAFQYVDSEGKLAGYPWNPNGSLDNIAGICDESGRIFGIMPHPEAYSHRTNHPRWTREKLPEEGAGLKIFRNAVEFIEKEF